jgi:WD40 repeat protein
MKARLAIAMLLLAAPAPLCPQAADSTLARQTPLAVLDRHRAGVTSVKFSPQGDLLASADLMGKVVMWRTGNWSYVRTLNHGSEVYSLAFSPDGKTLASAGGDQKVRIWSTRTGQEIRRIAMDHRIPAIVFSPDGTLLIGTEDGVVHFVNGSNGREMRSFKAGGSVLELAVSADGNRLATALPIRVWDYRSLTKRNTLTSLGQLGLAFSADGACLASAESTGGALIWTLSDSATYTPLRATAEKKSMGLRGFESFTVNMPVASIDVSRNADLVVGGGTNGLVYEWRPSGRPPEPTMLGGHAMTVSAVALSPAENLIASGSLDRTIRIWKVDSSKTTNAPSRGAGCK